MRNEFEYSYRVLQFNLSAGLSDFEVPIHAERVDYVSPTDGPELQIRLQTKSNDQLPLRPNGSIEAPFTRLYISASAVAKTVFLMVGAPAGVKVTGRDVAISGTINASIVSDAPLYQLGQNNLYEASPLVSTVTNTATIQLKNPVGSGKIVTILKSFIICSAAVQFNWGRLDANAATLIRNVKNHNVGLSAGVSEVRTQTPSVGLTDQWGDGLLGANLSVPLVEAVRLDPGEGFAINTTTSASYNTAVQFLIKEE